MPIQSIQIELEDVTDLIPDNVNIAQSEVDKLLSTDPSRAFPLDEMKTFISDTQNSLLTLGVDNAKQLSQQIGSLTPSQLSETLFNSGFSSGQISDFNFDIDSVNDVFSSIDGFQNSLQGGSATFLNALRQTTDVGLKSLADLDIERTLGTFTSNVSRDIASIVADASKNGSQILSEAIGGATSALESVQDELLSATAITPGLINSTLARAREAFDLAIDGNVTSLTSGIESKITEVVPLAQSVSDELIKNSAVKLKNFDTLVDGLDKSLPELSMRATGEVKESLRRLRPLVESLQSDKQKATNRIASAATSKVAKQLNTDASIEDVANLAKKQTTQALEEFKKKLDAESQALSDRGKKAEAVIADLASASKSRSVDPALDGRPVAKRSAVVAQCMRPTPTGSSLDFTGVSGDVTYDGPPIEKIEPSLFAKSRYKNKIASKLNELHPKVQKRYARAIVKFLDTYRDQGWDITVTSGYRSIAKQQALYNKIKPTGGAVARPGNSWHNYRVAIDVALIYKGKASWDGDTYVNMLTPFMEEENLWNFIPNDRIHFQPKELPKSAWSVKNQLLTAQGRVDYKRLSGLLS